MLDKQALCSLIPHAGSMCLLDEVIAWDNDNIRCISHSHRNADNPLRSNGRLAAICGVEYAAQAMAVHGGLVSENQDTPAIGYLAALRGLTLYVETLNDQGEELTITAKRLAGDSNGFIYSFSVESADNILLEGRATVINETGDSPS